MARSVLRRITCFSALLGALAAPSFASDTTTSDATTSDVTISNVTRIAPRPDPSELFEIPEPEPPEPETACGCATLTGVVELDDGDGERDEPQRLVLRVADDTVYVMALDWRSSVLFNHVGEKLSVDGVVAEGRFGDRVLSVSSFQPHRAPENEPMRIVEYDPLDAATVSGGSHDASER